MLGWYISDLLTSFAPVKATPEKAYLSTIRVTPWLNFSLIDGLNKIMACYLLKMKID